MGLFRAVDETRKAAIEQAVLAAAERVLDAKGYQNASMRDIAQEAGCAIGSLYLYFANKDVLFEALVNLHICRLTQSLTESLQRDADIVERLRLNSKVLLEYFNAHRGFFRIFFSELRGRGGSDLGLTGAGREAYERFKAYELSIMEQAQRELRVRTDIPAAELRALIHDVAIAALTRWTRNGKSVSIEAQMEALWGFISGGLAVRPA